MSLSMRRLEKMFEVEKSSFFAICEAQRRHGADVELERRRMACLHKMRAIVQRTNQLNLSAIVAHLDHPEIETTVAIFSLARPINALRM